MFIRVINDVHLRGVNPTHTYEELALSIKSSPYPVYLAGDIFDFANCPTKDLSALLTEAILIINLVKSLGGCFVLGNHECNCVPGINEIIINESILITHGDIPMWGKERSDKFRSQTPGAGWFKRNLIAKFIDSLRHLLAVRPNKNLLDWVDEKKKQYPNLKTVIMGHSHPPATVEFVRGLVYGMIMKRGVNDVNVAL